MKKAAILFLIAGVSIAVSAQRMADSTYWFFFTDKEDNGFKLDNPHAFLSERSIERRAWQGLSLDPTDLPLTSDYVDSLEQLGLKIVHRSKWLNGVLVESNDLPLIDTIARISFVDTIPWKPVEMTQSLLPPSGSRFDLPEPASFNYGPSFQQVRQLRIDYLHEKGYTGSGVYVTVLDGGFINMNENLPAFISLYQEGRLVASRNYVRNLSGVYDGISHGTSVSSLIAGAWDGLLIGTGPDASLIIAATENPASETRIEEFAWIEAAEWADSLGTDIINTSLGYTTFDDSTTNYTYEDMNGKTAFISRANSMLADKGIISVTSAGNSGDDQWYYISAPADASDILAVGAVDSLGVITSFSSRGPTYDQRIKPEVVARGRLAVIQHSDSTARLGNGTSYASPLIAGATASLWQAYPEMNARELMRAILVASDRFRNPDATYGFGLPDFLAAFHTISSVPDLHREDDILVYPNPFRRILQIDIPDDKGGDYNISLFDLQGRLVFTEKTHLPGTVSLPPDLFTGIYLLELKNHSTRYRIKVMK